MEEKVKKTCNRKRNKRLTLFFTNTERKVIDEMAEVTGSSITDMLVKAVKEYKKQVKKELKKKELQENND